MVTLIKPPPYAELSMFDNNGWIHHNYKRYRLSRNNFFKVYLIRIGTFKLFLMCHLPLNVQLYHHVLQIVIDCSKNITVDKIVLLFA